LREKNNVLWESGRRKSGKLNIYGKQINDDEKNV